MGHEENGSFDRNGRRQDHMCIRAYPNNEFIDARLCEAFSQRIIGQAIQWKPRSVDGKSTGTGFLLNSCYILSCRAVNSIAGNDTVCSKSLISNDHSSTGLVLEVILDAAVKSKLYANRKCVLIDVFLNKTTVRK